MTRIGSRLRRAAMPLGLLIAVVAVACGGSGVDAVALVNLETGVCANQGGGTLVFAQLTDGAVDDVSVSQITEYLAEFGFKHDTVVRHMSLAQAGVGIADCTVHVVTGAPADWSVSGATDYGAMYSDSSGPVHKYGVAQLDELAPGFSAALGRMTIPLKRVEESTAWIEAEKRPWFRDQDDPRWAPRRPWKVAAYYYWEYDFTDGSWKDWFAGEFAPFDGLRKITQAVTREIRGTPYTGEDQYEDKYGDLDLDDENSILLDSRTKITADGDLVLR